MGHVIAIDGPAGAGKSTVARQLAQRLGWRFLDTGALYRAVALTAIEQGLSARDGTALGTAARALPLRQTCDGRTSIGDRDVSEAIRSDAVTALASQTSSVAEVRAALLDIQRAAGRDANLVCEGRDMGSVVFPDATLKIFLDARPETRADRRAQELVAKGQAADAATVLESLSQRDLADSTRANAPLRRVAGQVALDTTGMSVDQVVNHILELVSERLRDGSVRM